MRNGTAESVQSLRGIIRSTLTLVMVRFRFIDLVNNRMLELGLGMHRSVRRGATNTKLYYTWLGTCRLARGGRNSKRRRRRVGFGASGIRTIIIIKRRELPAKARTLNGGG